MMVMSPSAGMRINAFGANAPAASAAAPAADATPGNASAIASSRQEAISTPPPASADTRKKDRRSNTADAMTSFPFPRCRDLEFAPDDKLRPLSLFGNALDELVHPATGGTLRLRRSRRQARHRGVGS